MKRVMAICAIVVVVVSMVVGCWELTYPGPNDPKSLQYVLWKAGMYKLNLDTATEVMVGDASKSKLVIGKTIPELQKKFGYLLPPKETSKYNRDCYLSSSWKDKRVLFIRHSNWMVVFDGDRATDLVLIKGC